MKQVTSLFLKNYKVIYWDFDGVILDSMSIRTSGFREVLSDYPIMQVDELIDYHIKNGGLSRYKKFEYFFETIRKEKIDNKKIKHLTNNFSAIMLDLLTTEKLLIAETIDFIKNNYQNYKFHIVSGSDGKELRMICNSLNLDNYFYTIEGSPTHKIELIKNSLLENDYNPNDCLLIGDSINDFDAANRNKITFLGYNNIDLLRSVEYYIKKF